MKNRHFFSAYTALLILLTLTGPAEQLYAQNRADFFVVDKPDAFFLLNQYQQNVTVNDGSILQPYVPMRILENQTTLSDGFTGALHVMAGGKEFYLLRDEEGELEFTSEPGFRRVFNNGYILQDSIRILRDGAVSLTHISTGDAITPMREGETVKGIFRQGNDVYVHVSRANPQYGWLSLPRSARGTEWDYLEQGTRREIRITEKDREAVKRLIEQVNELYRKYFRLLEEQSGNAVDIPAWQTESHDEEIVLTLLHYGQAEALQESTQLFINDLRSELIGRGLLIDVSGETIRITPPEPDGGQ